MQFRLEPGLPSIEADANQLQQMVMNLVSNAIEAIGEAAGRITISTGRDADGCPYLEVADDGCGMDAETKSRIFDPFFTTKFTGRGLGLAAVAGIVRGHKGGHPGHQRSRRRLDFPRHVPVRSTGDRPLPWRPRRRNAIRSPYWLWMTKSMVRRIAQASLEIRGYRVLLAANGLEAIQMVEKHPRSGWCCSISPCP